MSVRCAEIRRAGADRRRRRPSAQRRYRIRAIDPMSSGISSGKKDPPQRSQSAQSRIARGFARQRLATPSVTSVRSAVDLCGTRAMRTDDKTKLRKRLTRPRARERATDAPPLPAPRHGTAPLCRPIHDVKKRPTTPWTGGAASAWPDPEYGNKARTCQRQKISPVSAAREWRRCCRPWSGGRRSCSRCAPGRRCRYRSRPGRCLLRGLREHIGEVRLILF
jgi:hypothetical protein